ncbi:MAG: replication initiator protein A [Alphaproteobacteria bacterium]|nr:replication initiator protein A [Alphaproteobacteria bacterium]
MVRRQTAIVDTGAEERADALLPVRHPQQELFLCDMADAVLKDDMASMEHPFFSLTTKPDRKIRRYENGNTWLEVVPSVKGLATIYDKDILIFASSQLMAARKRGRPISQELLLTARDVLVFTNRHTGGRDYELLAEALARLQGTQVQTNIKTAGKEERHVFGLVDSASIARDPKSGRITELRIKLSDWFFRAIEAQEVLTLHADYFRLRKPIERRIYEIARKHCGAQWEWKISLDLLRAKCGTKDTLRKFRFNVRELMEKNHLPDYEVRLDERDMVIFRSRKGQEKLEAQSEKIALQIGPEAYHDARQVAPGWDVYVLEDKWRRWMIDGGLDVPHDSTKAFIGFCRRYYERHGAP